MAAATARLLVSYVRALLRQVPDVPDVSDLTPPRRAAVRAQLLPPPQLSIKLYCHHTVSPGLLLPYFIPTVFVRQYLPEYVVRIERYRLWSRFRRGRKSLTVGRLLTGHSRARRKWFRRPQFERRYIRRH